MVSGCFRIKCGVGHQTGWVEYLSISTYACMYESVSEHTRT